MIDYEKLRIAHELAIASEYWLETEIGRNESDSKKPWIHYRIILDGGDVILDDPNLDFIIEKLQELTQPKPKYEVGQEVYVLHKGDIKNVEILDIELRSEDKEYTYEIKEPRLWWYESELHPTKAALIQDQIKYWQSISEVQPGGEGKTGPIDFYPALEGPIKFVQSPGLCASTQCQHETGAINSTMLAKDIICIKCSEYIHKDSIFEDECQHENKAFNQQNCRHGIYDNSCGNCQPKECQHESDPMWYLSYPPQNKCKKCGEFYR